MSYVDNQFETSDLFAAKNLQLVLQSICALHLYVNKNNGSLKSKTESMGSGKLTSKRDGITSSNSSGNLHTSKIISPSTTSSSSSAPSTPGPSEKPHHKTVIGTSNVEGSPSKSKAPSVASLAADIATKEEFKYNPELEKAAMVWIEKCTSIHFQDLSFHSYLKSGVVLCKLINSIQASIVPSIYEGTLAYRQMENIGWYIKACQQIGLRDEELFETPDLFYEKNLNSVVNHIHALAHFLVKKQGSSWSGPVIDDVRDAKSLFSATLVEENWDKIGSVADSIPLTDEQEELRKWANSKLANRSGGLFGMSDFSSALESPSSSSSTAAASSSNSNQTIQFKNLSSDVKSGVKLIKLLEILCGVSFGLYNPNPTMIWHGMQNASAILQFITSQTFEKVEGVRSVDIVMGNVGPIAKLFFYLRAKFDLEYLFAQTLGTFGFFGEATNPNGQPNFTVNSGEINQLFQSTDSVETAATSTTGSDAMLVTHFEDGMDVEDGEVVEFVEGDEVPEHIRCLLSPADLERYDQLAKERKYELEQEKFEESSDKSASSETKPLKDTQISAESTTPPLFSNTSNATGSSETVVVVTPTFVSSESATTRNAVAVGTSPRQHVAAELTSVVQQPVPINQKKVPIVTITDKATPEPTKTPEKTPTETKSPKKEVPVTNEKPKVDDSYSVTSSKKQDVSYTAEASSDASGTGSKKWSQAATPKAPNNLAMADSSPSPAADIMDEILTEVKFQTDNAVAALTVPSLTPAYDDLHSSSSSPALVTDPLDPNRKIKVKRTKKDKPEKDPTTATKDKEREKSSPSKEKEKHRKLKESTTRSSEAVDSPPKKKSRKDRSSGSHQSSVNSEDTQDAQSTTSDSTSASTMSDALSPSASKDSIQNIKSTSLQTINSTMTTNTAFLSNPHSSESNISSQSAPKLSSVTSNAGTTAGAGVGSDQQYPHTPTKGEATQQPSPTSPDYTADYHRKRTHGRETSAAVRLLVKRPINSNGGSGANIASPGATKFVPASPRTQHGAPGTPHSPAGSQNAIDLEKVAKAQQVVRKHVATEILTTEQSYLASLQVLVNGLLEPLKKAKVITDAEYTSLFSNIEEIVVEQSKFEAVLKPRIMQWGNSSIVSDIFLTQTSFFLKYGPYLENYNKATAALHYVKKKYPRFEAMVKSFEDELMKSTMQTLDSFLIMPVQRLPRYRLLLTDMRKYTAAASTEHKALESAIEHVDGVIRELNSHIDQNGAANTKKVLQVDASIQGDHHIMNVNRKFVKEGTFYIKKLKVDKSRPDRKKLGEKLRGLKSYAFLFNDVLVVCDYLKSAKSDDQVQFSHVHTFNLQTSTPFVITEKERLEKNMDTIANFKIKAHDKKMKDLLFYIHVESDLLIVQCTTPEEREAWVKSLPTSTNSS